MLALVLSTLAEVMKGPLRDILTRFVPDADARLRLEAELSARLLDEARVRLSAQASIIGLEITQGGWLTRNWRPMLMVFIIFLLAFHGVLLPLADLALGHRLEFAPRWADIPDRLWDLLSIGLGGYIGGRTLEKLAAHLPGAGKSR